MSMMELIKQYPLGQLYADMLIKRSIMEEKNLRVELMEYPSGMQLRRAEEANKDYRIARDLFEKEFYGVLEKTQ